MKRPLRTRQTTTEFSGEILDAFRALRRVRNNSELFWSAHGRLYDEFEAAGVLEAREIPLFQWPLCERPDLSAGRPDAAQRLWLELEAACHRQDDQERRSLGKQIRRREAAPA